MKTLTKKLKSFLRPIYYKFFVHTKTLQEIHDYWKNPDVDNKAEDYLTYDKRSKFLMRFIPKYTDKNSSILEIGCNVGRNLHELFSNGYRNLEGIEISKIAIDLMEYYYPEMYKAIKIINQPVEEIIKGINDNKYDVVFVMAVLEHIHYKSDWIMKEIARITGKYLIVIEEEGATSWRHFPRKYKKIFEKLGMRQVYEFDCEKNLKEDDCDLRKGYFVRVFSK